ncbi:MAG TPA: hypothetical protein VLD13_05590 [Gaiellaceae bacterium]|nr:hypothetical protein [Gaiellaceae bacterium]
MGRAIAVLFATAALSAGCGGSGTSVGTSGNASLDSILKRPGPDVAVTPGAAEFVPGDVRYPFLVIRNDARPVERPAATVWAATSRSRAPFARTRARLEPIGIPGRSAPAFGGVSRIYVAHLRIPRPGRYWLVAQPDGARIQAVGVLGVAARSASPAIGAKAPRSQTPTLATAPAARITTSRPPDLPLLRYSIAGSLAAHKPFVVTFATPKFCTSRTCGPVVDVLEAVRRRFERRGVRFIHVEVFTGNDPSRGYNRWMRQWGLASEPWVFLVGADGRVKAKFEGSVSAAELAAAVRGKLR